MTQLPGRLVPGVWSILPDGLINEVAYLDESELNSINSSSMSGCLRT